MRAISATVIRQRHGEAAVALLDQRLGGGQSKELIGTPGLETSYQVKQVTQAIKRSLESWGASDPEFLALVRRAMEEEKETVARRFAGKQS